MGQAESTEAFKKAIDENNTRYLKAYRERKMQIIADMYTKDCRFMPSGFPIQMGPDGIAGFWTKAVELGFHILWFETAETIGPIKDGNCQIAMERCVYKFFDKDDKVIQTGKYIVVWKMEDGVWKYHWDIWNPDHM